MLSMVTSSFLFLQRVQAVYADSKWVRRIFFVWWLIFSATNVLIPVGINPTYIPGTLYYLDAGIPPYVSLTVFCLLVYDTSVFIAISYKLQQTSPTYGRVPWRSAMSGNVLPRLSRAVFRGGQQYYL